MEQEEIGIVTRACVILRNMIIEDKHNNYELTFDYDVVKAIALEPIVNHEHHPCYEVYFQRMTVIRDPQTYACIQVDLIEEIWK